MRIESLATLVALAVSTSAVQAAPSTFRFEAVVVSTSISSPSPLPFSIEPSKTIRGSFTVPSIQFGSSELEGIGFTVEIEQTTLELQGAFGRMKSDEFVGEGSEPLLGPLDSIQLGCIATEINESVPLCVEGDVPGTSDIKWRPNLGFGFGDVLSEGEELSNVNTWNAFNIGTLSVDFTTVEGTKIGTFSAQLTDVAVIPEPTAILLVAQAVFATALSRIMASRGEY